LEGTDLSDLIPLLKEIAERDDMAPLVTTFALTLLQQAGYTEEVIVHMVGWKKSIIPVNMTLPGQDDMTKEVLANIERLLLKDPSRLEMAHSLIEKFAITAFPFGWGEYLVEEVAEAYTTYIECLFSGAPLPETELHALIHR